MTRHVTPINLEAVQIRDSARKHGVADDDIHHAWRNVIATAEQEFDGELRIIAIGPARDGSLLELVLVPAETPARIIHAAPARPSFRTRLNLR